MTPVTVTELGTERRCNACGEWWPLDGEFFYRHPRGHGGFMGMCKACRAERRGVVDPRMGRVANRTLIRAMLALGRAPNDIAKHVGCSRSTVYRSRGQPPIAHPASSTTIAA